MVLSRRILFNISVILLLFSFSCTTKQKRANNYLTDAHIALEEKNYSLAKLKIDSIKLLFPKSFNEINKGFELMQDIRYAENNRNILFCDSMLKISYSNLNSMLKNFIYERDPQYQEFGNYIPRTLPLNDALLSNGLRTAVNENGNLYIESVYSGSPIKHNKIMVSTGDDSFAETLPVTSDGLNYQFKTIDKTYEIVRYTGNNDNGVANFIYTFKNENLKLTFIGTRKQSATITTKTKDAIAQSYELSNLILNIEELKYEKGRSEALIKYLDSKKKGE